MNWSNILSFQLLLLVILGMVLVASGCRVVATGAALTVGTAAIAGYTVYEGGKMAAVSVQKVTKRGSRGVGDIVYSSGRFQTQCPYNLEEIYNAATNVFNIMGFRQIKGKSDALSGSIMAQTVKGEEISLGLKFIEDGLTAIQIKIGIKGDLMNSEYIYDRILTELGKENP